ncbi:MAG TPA: glycosyltransferase family 39 protein, partial [Acetobacteraceae bacterium]|nr:glycosyltransferase family 39 protein [Acetobacteraceae bacterium]
MLEARAMQPGRTAFLDTLPETRRPFLWLALLCLLLWVPGFVSAPPSDRDESRFAQATRQMMESGDYVRLAVGQEERNKKPVGIHWAQAATVHVLEAVGLPARGHIAAYRIPSLLGALLAVLANFHWGRALVGRRAAFVAAAMLAPCMVLVVEAHIAKTDAALLASVTAAMGLLARAYLVPRGFTARQAAAFWAILGISILLKGPIGPMVALTAGITLAVMDRGAPWLRALRPAWGVPLMVALAAPWFVAIGIATEGRFFSEAVGGDMIAKVGSGEESHWGPPGLYTLIFGITAFPAAWIVVRAIPSMWADRMRPEVRFLLAWAVPVWLLFEAFATKLPHYTLPAFPALMLLGARWAMDPLRHEPPAWLRWLSAASLVGTAVGLGLVALGVAILMERRTVVIAAALAAVAAGAVLAWFTLRAAREGQYGRAAILGAVLAVPLYAAVLEG